MSKLQKKVEGVFRHMVYSPKGEHEGVLLESNGGSLQLVFERHDTESPRVFEGIQAGQTVSVEALLQGPSPKGSGAHPVYAFGRIVSVDGKKPARSPATAPGAAYRGKIVRLNFARHGAANGFVLDTGDFIHTKPEGCTWLELGVGDSVEADGDARRLADDTGWAVEATHVNGYELKAQ